ncbi:MAG TPA: cyclic nucleotide-binding domain-containing protein [Gammaproteobacteria bacterium]|nr:cyclic nucleotide-binding domain-containing protein [Gammaproteobacteria bacterium]
MWEIIRACVWQEYSADSEIIVEGDIDDAFFVITDGTVEVQRDSKTIGQLHKGDCFGEMGYIANMERTATIRAKNFVRLMKINGTMIDQLSVGCQLHFNKVFLRTLVRRLSLTTHKASTVN